jgi:hypothetical protein
MNRRKFLAGSAGGILAFSLAEAFPRRGGIDLRKCIPPFLNRGFWKNVVYMRKTFLACPPQVLAKPYYP